MASENCYSAGLHLVKADYVANRAFLLPDPNNVTDNLVLFEVWRQKSIAIIIMLEFVTQCMIASSCIFEASQMIMPCPPNKNISKLYKNLNTHHPEVKNISSIQPKTPSFIPGRWWSLQSDFQTLITQKWHKISISFFHILKI